MHAQMLGFSSLERVCRSHFFICHSHLKLSSLCFFTRTKYRKVSLSLYCFCRKTIGQFFGESLVNLWNLRNYFTKSKFVNTRTRYKIMFRIKENEKCTAGNKLSFRIKFAFVKLYYTYAMRDNLSKPSCLVICAKQNKVSGLSTILTSFLCKATL